MDCWNLTMEMPILEAWCYNGQMIPFHALGPRSAMGTGTEGEDRPHSSVAEVAEVQQTGLRLNCCRSETRL
jgi:hypothetical protein